MIVEVEPIMMLFRTARSVFFTKVREVDLLKQAVPL